VGDHGIHVANPYDRFCPSACLPILSFRHQTQTGRVIGSPGAATAWRVVPFGPARMHCALRCSNPVVTAPMSTLIRRRNPARNSKQRYPRPTPEVIERVVAGSLSSGQVCHQPCCAATIPSPSVPFKRARARGHKEPANANSAGTSVPQRAEFGRPRERPTVPALPSPTLDAGRCWSCLENVARIRI
jgi:hypothetical protein